MLITSRNTAVHFHVPLATCRESQHLPGLVALCEIDCRADTWIICFAIDSSTIQSGNRAEARRADKK